MGVIIVRVRGISHRDALAGYDDFHTLLAEHARERMAEEALNNHGSLL